MMLTARRTVSIALMMACALLASCESQPERPMEPPSAPREARQEQNVDQLLMAADRASGSNAALYRLRAAELALDGQHTEQAARILGAIQANVLPPQDLPRYIAGKARVALAEGNPEDALNWLLSDLIEPDRLALPDQIALSLLRAEAYQATRRYLASARERIYIDPLLPEKRRPDNEREIWNALMELPGRTLTAEAESALTNDLRGWLALAAVARQYQGNIDEQVAQLKKWRQLWPGHPAAAMLPERLSLLTELVTHKPRKLALFLPLDGELGPYGRAIRDGFLAANYDAMQRVEATPEITVFDTTRGDLIDLYNQALSAGIEMIVGPLDRANVDRLARIEQLPIPVLALNRAQDQPTFPQNLYQFGLAPEDEVLQVAAQAWREGLRRALLIVPDNEWGHRNATAFEADWQARGGEIAAERFFTTQNDYSDMVRSLLDVDQSEKRAVDLRRVIREPFEFDPRRRRDVDFIVLLANSLQARGINPTLAFFFAEDLPVYSTSHINDKSESRIDYVDLNGIRFCDIPWKLTQTDPLQLSIQGAWSGASRLLAPFYALGVDAYQLYPRVRQFLAFPSDRLYGSTGVLRLDQRGIVSRQLMWAQIRDGQVLSIPMVLDVSPPPPHS